MSLYIVFRLKISFKRRGAGRLDSKVSLWLIDKKKIIDKLAQHLVINFELSVKQLFIEGDFIQRNRAMHCVYPTSHSGCT